jgi:hypothetical protein
MDPLDRFLRRPLAEVLVSQGVLAKEQVEKLAESAHATGDSLGEALIDSGALTAWDFARVVATHYQMPVHPLAGYKFDADLGAGYSPDLLHRHKIVPLARFGRTRTFAVMEPPTRALLADLQQAVGHATPLYFFVAPGDEIRRVLEDKVKVVDVSADPTWQNIFDSAEQEVLKELKKG